MSIIVWQVFEYDTRRRNIPFFGSRVISGPRGEAGMLGIGVDSRGVD